MTEEQIRQNAENAYPGFEDLQAVYIEGAHSRDEEIGRMNTTIRLYANQIALLRKEIEQLRNPWISVEDRLPEKTRELELLEDEHDKVVIVCRRFGEVVTAYLDAEEIWRLYPTGQPFYGEITHWMPIPQIKKGGKE